jgi:hypothetical protein
MKWIGSHSDIDCSRMVVAVLPVREHPSTVSHEKWSVVKYVWLCASLFEAYSTEFVIVESGRSFQGFYRKETESFWLFWKYFEHMS